MDPSTSYEPDDVARAFGQAEHALALGIGRRRVGIMCPGEAAISVQGQNGPQGVMGSIRHGLEKATKRTMMHDDIEWHYSKLVEQININHGRISSVTRTWARRPVTSP